MRAVTYSVVSGPTHVVDWSRNPSKRCTPDMIARGVDKTQRMLLRALRQATLFSHEIVGTESTRGMKMNRSLLLVLPLVVLTVCAGNAHAALTANGSRICDSSRVALVLGGRGGVLWAWGPAGPSKPTRKRDQGRRRSIA